MLQLKFSISLVVRNNSFQFNSIVVKVGSCVPRLSVKCVQALAKFFCHKPGKILTNKSHICYMYVITSINLDAGCKLRGGDRALFLSMLSTKESITLTAEKIPDEVLNNFTFQKKLH